MEKQRKTPPPAPKRLLATALTVLASGIAACSSDTVIFLTIDSDLRVPAELDAVRVEVETREKSLMNQSYPIESQDDLPATLTITAVNDKEAEVHIIVTGLKGAAEVGWGDAWATFIKNETVDVSVVITKRPPPGEDGGADSGVGADSGRDAGRDAGIDAEMNDADAAASDAGTDTAADTGPDDDNNTGPEPAGDSGPDTGIPDVATEDTGADAGAEGDEDAFDGGPADANGGGDSEIADAQDADALADAGWDSGYWIGARCVPDAGCGQTMNCIDPMSAPEHAFCTAECADAGCPAESWCLTQSTPDAGPLCVKSCAKHTDCLRSDMGCYNVFDAGFGCIPNLAPGDKILEYPRVEVLPDAPNPAVGESVQLVATHFDEEHAEVPGASFTWYSSDINIATVTANGLVDAVAFGKAQITARGQSLESQTDVSVEAVVTTLAGDGNEGFVDGKGATARFVTPEFVVVNGTDIYVNDHDVSVFQPAIRKVTSDGTVTTWSRSQPGCADGDLFSSGYNIDGLTNRSGNNDIFFSDKRCNAIRKLTPAGVTTIFSSTKGFADGDRATAKIDDPTAIEATDDGILFFDSNNHRIRLMPYDGSSITTVAGSGTPGATDGPALEAQLERVGGIATPGSAADFHFTETDRHLVKRVSGGQVNTWSGSGVNWDKDGSAADGAFSFPRLLLGLQGGGLAVCASRIRILDDKGTVSTAACEKVGYLQDGKYSDCALHVPTGIALYPPSGYVFADSSNHAVRILRVRR